MTKIEKIVPENHEKSTGLNMSHHNFKSNPMGYPENLVTLSDIEQNIICVKRLFGMGVRTTSEITYESREALPLINANRF